MRRWTTLALLVGLCVSGVAEAKTLVLWTQPGSAAGTAKQEFTTQQNRNLRLVTSCLEATGAVEGVDFKVVKSMNNSTAAIKGTNSTARTEFVRKGQMVWNFGTAGAHAEQFDAVVSVGWYGGTHYSVRLDSLMLPEYLNDAGGLSVPVLVFTTNAEMLVPAVSPSTAAMACSIGVAWDPHGAGDALANSGNADMQQLITDPTHYSWVNTAYVSGMLENADCVRPGGIRKLIRSSQSPLTYLNSRAYNAAWADSAYNYSATADTLHLWDLLNAHIPGSKSMTIACAWGAGAMVDSLADANDPSSTVRPATEGDIPLIMMALAHLDSLSGGKVFGHKPLKVAFTVDQACSRGNRRGPHGPYVDDESAYYAVLDSIAALGVPITFGVNVDSLTAYAAEVAKLKAIARARFAPQSWRMIADTSDTPGNTTASSDRLIDVWGHNRKRVYVGDGSATDTSLFALLRQQRIKADVVFGSARVSRFALAPLDDWSPLGLTGRNRANELDSLFYAVTLAGYSGIRVDGQRPEANANTNVGPGKTNPLGYYNRQGYQRWSLASASGGMKLLAHNGFYLGGGALQWAGEGGDSTAADRFGLLYAEYNREWIGLTQDHDNPYDLFPYSWLGAGDPRLVNDVVASVDRFHAPRRAYVRKLHAGDFSGATGGTNGPPARPGWWILKNMVIQARAINLLAGRPIVTFTYPENVEP